MPSTSAEEPVQQPTTPKVLSFVYKGVEYDATEYSKKHPGGNEIIKNMASERKDFTEYFRALHSDQAQLTLKSLPVLSNIGESTPSKQYFQLMSKVEHLFKPNYVKQFLLVGFIALLFLYGCFGSNTILCILGFALSQVVVGWIAHSMAHSRVPTLQTIGYMIAGTFGGLSLSWWSPKHNAHHMFTNSLLYDDDIKHDYKVYLYPFLYLKWRFDSAYSSITNKKYNQIAFMIINYWLLTFQTPWIFIVGELIGGFYSAFVLIGNHEKEVKFPSTVKLSFIDHQIIACRNYNKTGLIWLILMGGMQYQSEHHLFPQILFYNLPQASKIIKAELAKKDKKLIYGPVL